MVKKGEGLFFINFHPAGELEASVCKAFQGAAIVGLLQALNRAADGSFQLVHQVYTPYD